MAFTVDIAFVQEFDRNVHRLLQQTESFLRPLVRVKSNVVGKLCNFERLGPVELQARTSRHSPTIYTPATHSRRRCFFADYEGSELLDQEDEVRMLISPESEYAQNFAEGIARQWDRLIINAAVGNSVSVDAAEAQSNVALGAGQTILTGTLPFSVDKVRQASRKLNEAACPQSDRVFAISPASLEQLLRDPQVMSDQYHMGQGRALQEGGLGDRTWMGFIWRMIPDSDAGNMLPKTSNTRTNIAFHKAGIGLGIPMDMNISIDKRPDLGNATQILAKMVGGAVRIEEKRVVAVESDENL